MNCAYFFSMSFPPENLNENSFPLLGLIVFEGTSMTVSSQRRLQREKRITGQKVQPSSSLMPRPPMKARPAVHADDCQYLLDTDGGPGSEAMTMTFSASQMQDCRTPMKSLSGTFCTGLHFQAIIGRVCMEKAIDTGRRKRATLLFITVAPQYYGAGASSRS